MPFDLSDGSGSNKEHESATSTSAAPTGRASDLLMGGAQQPKSGAKFDTSNFLNSRPMTPVDGVASGALYLALFVNVVCIAYIFYNVWSGSIAEPHFTQAYTHDQRLGLMSNINNIDTVIAWTAWISTIATAFLFFDIPYVGYVLILIAAMFNVGVPMLSGYFLTLSKSSPTIATDTAVQFMAHEAWVPLLFGIPLICVDLVRRVMDGIANSKSRPTTFKYGKGAVKQLEKRNVFLGSCWNMPYCRQIARGKCPVHAKNQGPCWRKKSGCMCDEQVSVIATTPGNWKAAVNSAMGSIDNDVLETKSSTNPLLNMAPSGGRTVLTYREKAARCRECIIYNAHQEQKYKVSVAVLLGGTVVMLAFFNGPLIAGVSHLYDGLNMALQHFSLASTAGTPAIGGDDITGPVAWFVLSILTILVLSKMLQLVEYLCFTLKV